MKKPVSVKKPVLVEPKRAGSAAVQTAKKSKDQGKTPAAVAGRTKAVTQASPAKKVSTPKVAEGKTAVAGSRSATTAAKPVKGKTAVAGAGVKAPSGGASREEGKTRTRTTGLAAAKGTVRAEGKAGGGVKPVARVSETAGTSRKVEKVAGRRDGGERGGRTPAPPATVKRTTVAARSTVAESPSQKAGVAIPVTMKPKTGRAPFGPDDAEDGDVGGEDGALGILDDGLGAEGLGVAETVAQAETPMVMIFGMGGGAGAAAWNATVPAAGGGGKELPAAMPVAPGRPTAPEPEVPAPTSAGAAGESSEAAAPERNGTDGPLIAVVPTDPGGAMPSPETSVPEQAEEVLAAVKEAAPESPVAVTPLEVEETPVPAAAAAVAAAVAGTPAAELEGLAEVARSLPTPQVRAAVAATVDSLAGAVGERTRATVQALASEVRTAVSPPDARVVTVSDQRSSTEEPVGPPARSGSAEAPDQSVATPTAAAAPGPGEPVRESERWRASAPGRLPIPEAPDELAPQRADRSGSAFDVPAAAGQLLIAANAQTDFEMEKRRVIFSGHVIMKNERFYLTADTLVAYMKENQEGLKFAEAQGNVVVRMVENGRETGSSGLSKTAIFHPDTGEIVLRGWPQLRMGNKAHVASSATTEMSLFTDGRMKTSGRNQTMIVP